MSNSNSSDDENLELLQEIADPELFTDKLYKKSSEDIASISTKSLRKSATEEENCDNLYKLTPGAQNFIAKQLEQHLDNSLTYKSTLTNIISVKNKRSKSKIKLLTNSKHYIDVETELKEITVKRPFRKCEFDSEDEEKIKSVLIESENIVKETEHWNKNLVSLCVLRVEVYDKDTKMSESANQRKPKDIRVETFPSRLEVSADDWGLLPPEKGERIVPQGAEGPLEALETEEEIGFFSGNPFVELTKGIIHLYKEDALRDRSEAHILCLLGIPSSMTCHDLLSFTAPCHADIAHIRVLRDPTPNQYMALLVFRSHDAAAEFRASFDGAPYSGLEPDRICRAVWVSRVEWTEAPTQGDQPPAGHTELPTCPVCLERMDESIAGVLTILCNHAFHADCLVKWGDSTCPVCRCVQSPELSETGSECLACPASLPTPPADSLWICLVCGHVGCGRYHGGHAQMHYRDTGHCYALQLGSGRVWDYKGDNFVHRLLQNKADGKLVPSQSTSSHQPDSEDKIDSVQLEYTYLLTQQLDSQRRWYEEKLARAESVAAKDIEDREKELRETRSRENDLQEKIERLKKEKMANDKRISQLSHKLTTTQHELVEERQLGKALRANQSQWQARVQSLEKAKEDSDAEITSLKEQLRDLMFYLDAQQLIAKSENRDEIAEGTVTIASADDKKGKQRRRKR